MEYEELKKLLKKNNLTLRKFSELSEVSYRTCSGWGEEGRKVSDWVKPFLKLYSENQRLKKIEDMIKDMCTKQDVNTEK